MLLVSNHGGHSGEFCDHARGTKQELLDAYIAAGFSQVSLVEHLPPPSDRYLYPDEVEKGHDAAYLRGRFSRYLGEVREGLQQQAAGRLELFCGIETEFYGEDPCGWICQAVEQYRPEMIVASVHHVRDIPIDLSAELYQHAVQVAGGLDELYCAYYDAQYDLIQCTANYTSHMPVVLGHLDLIRLLSPHHRPGIEVNRRVIRNVRAAIDGGLIIEVNSRAYKKQLPEPYPALDILRQIRMLHGEITFGDDSHAPDEVGLYYGYAQEALWGVFQTVVAFKHGKSGGYEKVTLPLISDG